MPLSEEEQRILGEIEANLRASDPDLARQVGSTTVYSELSRRLKWGVVAFVAALIASVLLLTINYLLAFVGFLAVFAAAVFVENNARRLGKAGVNDATRAIRGGGLKGYFGLAGPRVKGRLKRDQDEGQS
ncbi:MAG: DUF3040 domain-containing protein [Microthrixaceae bacterium]